MNSIVEAIIRIMTIVASSHKGKWKKFKVPVTKHDIILPEVPPEVEVEGSLLGHIENLKYVNRYFRDLEKFP